MTATLKSCTECGALRILDDAVDQPCGVVYERPAPGVSVHVTLDDERRRACEGVMRPTSLPEALC